MMNISKKRLVVLGVSLAIGGWLGYQTGSGMASGGINAAFALGGIVLAGVILLIYVFIGVILAKQPDGTGGPAGRVTFIAAGLFAAAFGGGWLGSVALQPFRPVQLEAQGTVVLAVAGLAGFDGQDGAVAHCRSEVGSEFVVWLDANSAGTVGPDAVYASLSMFPSEPGIQPVVVVSISPIVKGPGKAPQWSGSAEFAEGTHGAATGRVTFTELDLGGDESGGPPAGWPLQLSGTLNWTCANWGE
jgi:hypothetical protein